MILQIGLISDTHDRLPFIDKAIQKLNQQKIALVLHAGDYSAPFVVNSFKHLKSKMIGVFGNNDAERNILSRKFEELHIDVSGTFKEIRFDGLKIALLHGENEELLGSIVNTQSYNLIVFGHTHKVKSSQKGDTLLVNPGEVCGYLTGKATISIFNTENGYVNNLLL